MIRILAFMGLLNIATAVSPVSPAALAGPAFGNGGDGRFSLEFSEPRVYDLTGNYNESIDILDVDYSIVQDMDGKLTGSGEAEASLLGVDIRINFRITGTVRGSNGVTRVKLKMTGDGVATNGFETVPFKFTSSVKAEIGSTTPTRVVGTVTAKVCAKGAGCAKSKTDFEAFVSDDGRWRLTLTLAETDKGLSGTAEVSTSGAAGPRSQAAQYTVTGKLGKESVAKLKLRPIDGGKSLSLAVVVTLQDGGPPLPGELRRAKGALFGQKVQASF